MLFFFFFFVIWTISNLFLPWRFQTAAWRTTAYPCWTRRWMIRETRRASAAGAASTLWAAATSSRKAWPCRDSTLSALDRCSTTATHARSWSCQLLTTTSWRSMPHDPSDNATNNRHVGLNLGPGWTLLRFFFFNLGRLGSMSPFLRRLQVVGMDSLLSMKPTADITD